MINTNIIIYAYVCIVYINIFRLWREHDVTENDSVWSPVLKSLLLSSLSLHFLIYKMKKDNHSSLSNIICIKRLTQS